MNKQLLSYLALPLLQEAVVRVLEGAPDGGHGVPRVVDVADNALRRRKTFEFRAKFKPNFPEKLTVWRWEEAKAAASFPAWPSNTA